MRHPPSSLEPPSTQHLEASTSHKSRALSLVRCCRALKPATLVLQRLATSHTMHHTLGIQ